MWQHNYEPVSGSLALSALVAGGKIKYAFIEGPDRMRIEIIEGRASKD